MKAIVTILFSLALVLSHLPAFASPVRQLCQNETRCDCGNSACCMKTSDATPAPVAPTPTADNSRLQLLAACQVVAHFVFAQLDGALPPTFRSVSPAPAAVPLYVRNCSYLI